MADSFYGATRCMCNPKISMCIDLVFFERPKDLQPPFVMHLSTLADVLALDQGGFLIIMAVSGK